MLSLKPLKAEARVKYDVAAKWSPFLATRERGRRVREEIEQRLAQLSAGDNLVLDFSGVEGITVSFGDECVAKLILARSSGDFADRGLVIEGANQDVTETLEAVLSRRKFSAISLNSTGEPEVLGERGWLPATLAAAIELRSFSASDLAAILNLTPQAANNRLKMLVASGAVARERIVPEGGGKEFSYRIVIPVYA
jgi:anti-anti-sigma regulatory factor